MDMSLKAYAAHRGVTPKAVREALESGRLTAASCRRGGHRWHINPTAADREWDGTTDPAQQRPPEAPSGAAQPGLFGRLDPPAGPTPAPANGQEGPTLARARALRVTFQAQRERLKFEREAEKMVLRDEVEVEAFRLARALRDNLLQIPARIREQLAAEDDPRAIEQLLHAEISVALQDLQK